MNASPWQKHSKLVPLFKRSFDLISLSLSRIRDLLLLRQDNAVFKYFHDPEELIERQFRLVVKLLLCKQLLCLVWVPAKTLDDCL
jgi:hypothetical protein